MKRMSNNMAITAILNLRLETTGEIFYQFFYLTCKSIYLILACAYEFSYVAPVSSVF